MHIFQSSLEIFPVDEFFRSKPQNFQVYPKFYDKKCFKFFGQKMCPRQQTCGLNMHTFQSSLEFFSSRPIYTVPPTYRNTGKIRAHAHIFQSSLEIFPVDEFFRSIPQNFQVYPTFYDKKCFKIFGQKMRPRNKHV